MECSAAASKETWELIYWSAIKEDGRNHMVGRGEFVRLLFEAAGVPYVDVGVQVGNEAVAAYVRGSSNPGFPAFAPPIVRKGSFVLSQTPTILRVLGREFGLYPAGGMADEAHADSVMGFLTDFVAEGRLVFHPKCFTQSYYEQVEEAKPYVQWFEETRMPRFMVYLEAVLAHTATGFVVGDRLTYVDVALFHTLDAAAHQFPAAFARCVEDNKAPRLVAFKAAFAQLPRIAAYLASDRRGFFEGNSMM